ncbi:MAG: cytochrome c biogenesis protein CcdA [Saprospiraceae bacterium]|nr:thioredoxin family protein [Saprospiraceae bacterium]MDW8228264.1 cytochrome c biogenesis protein CcdA [Saprospiraceae bacterium]
MRLRLIVWLLTTTLSSIVLTAQNPARWSFSSKEVGNGEYDLTFTVSLADGWNTYSQFLESEDGPVPTSFTFEEGPHYQRKGQVKESGNKSTKYDNVFGMNLTKFSGTGIFTQRVVVTDPSKPIKGYLTYMVCNDEMCLPPRDVDFSFTLTPSSGTGAAKPGATPDKPTAPPVAPSGNTPEALTPNDDQAAVTPTPKEMAAPNDPNFQGFFDSKRDINPQEYVSQCAAEPEERGSGWWVFIAGFLGGLIALLTPCVFPMIPLTVSFFTKRSRDRATGLRNALWYSASIVVIYVSLGILLTIIFGPTILNEMSTDMYFNLLFFAVFVVFALSFFGLFEITLPASWVESSDRMADKGGLIGIFFMAFTLALVSFSCTGPIVGTLLVETARSNAGDALFGFIPLRPLIGMTGFGLALALPFGLFAMFPGWLQSLPKSGNWMDNVKTTLGFVELALALKFLSTADMVRHWGILKFELFLGLWFLIALGLGLYQLGLLPFLKGASGRPGIGRLVTAGLALWFAGYLGYGLFNYQSLSLLSGIAPPVHYNYFRPMDCPHQLDCYHDFDEAARVARMENKPIFVDFTGYGCVNCRKMEENVWNKKEILALLRDRFVVASLYVDDQARLFPDDRQKYLLDHHTGEKIRTVGGKWSSFQINNFQRNSQPWYVLMHHDGKTLLNQPRGYTPDVDEYRSFLECGLAAFAQLQERQNAPALIGKSER